MHTTRLSSKGQVIIPQPIRLSHHWESGQQFIVIEQNDNIILKPKAPFPETTLDAVGGCLDYKGPTVSIDEMEEAIRAGVKDQIS